MKNEESRSYRFEKWWLRLFFGSVDKIGDQMMPQKTKGPIRSERLLVVRLDQLGDQIMILPFLDALHQYGNYPEVELLTTTPGSKILSRHPVITKTHIWDCPWFLGQGKSVSAFFWLKIFLEKWGDGCLVDLRGDVRIHTAAYLAKINERVSFGATGGGFLLTHEVNLPLNVHAIDESLALLDPLLSGGHFEAKVDPKRTQGSANHLSEKSQSQPIEAGGIESGVEFPGVPLLPRPWGKSEVENLPDVFITLHPDAGTPAKRWPLENWLELIHRLLYELPEKVHLVLVGANKDLDSYFGSRALSKRVHSTIGKTSLGQLETVLHRSRGLITMDSGPGHIAAALEKPVWVLWAGVARKERWKPRGKDVFILENRVDCAPCIRFVCPLDDHPCLTGLTVEKVVSGVMTQSHLLKL